MIDYKYILYTTIGIGVLFDILQDGLMSVGIILGWLIGLLTATQWDIEREERNKNKSKEIKRR